MSARPTPATRSVLYDAVAAGMWAYVRAAFRVETSGLERLRLGPSTILASTHRSDSDVPVLCGTLYAAVGGWRRRELRPGFAVRDDLFLPGFFAGYPHGVPLPLQRLLFHVSIGRVLRSRLACFPIRPATRMRLVEIARERPSLPLALLSAPDADALEQRARRRGLPLPHVAADTLRAEYADLLWRVVSAEELDRRDGLAPVWARRSTEATADLRRLIDLLRAGSMLFLFPEGRPSPDGSLGPIMRGVGALVRRGGGRLQPLAIAYDPLTDGRRRVVLAVGEPLEASGRELEPALLAAFRRTMPLTVGQLVAVRLARGGSPFTAEEAVAAAAAERGGGRAVERALLDVESAGARLAEAEAAARALGERHPVLARLVRTYESARET